MRSITSALDAACPRPRGPRHQPRFSGIAGIVSLNPSGNDLLEEVQLAFLLWGGRGVRGRIGGLGVRRSRRLLLGIRLRAFGILLRIACRHAALASGGVLLV